MGGERFGKNGLDLKAGACSDGGGQLLRRAGRVSLSGGERVNLSFPFPCLPGFGGRELLKGWACSPRNCPRRPKAEESGSESFLIPSALSEGLFCRQVWSQGKLRWPVASMGCPDGGPGDTVTFTRAGLNAKREASGSGTLQLPTRKRLLCGAEWSGTLGANLGGPGGGQCPWALEHGWQTLSCWYILARRRHHGGSSGAGVVAPGSRHPFLSLLPSEA